MRTNEKLEKPTTDKDERLFQPSDCNNFEGFKAFGVGIKADEINKNIETTEYYEIPLLGVI
jgi:hypothetical protein